MEPDIAFAMADLTAWVQKGSMAFATPSLARKVTGSVVKTLKSTLIKNRVKNRTQIKSATVLIDNSRKK